MPLHLQREINLLNRLILQMGGQVEENLRHALLALQNRDATRGAEMRKRDQLVNRLEIKVEESCLKILALHQPVASDLRYIVSVMKINNELERIGDLSEHIGRRTMHLSELTYPAFPSAIEQMSLITREMLRQSLDAMVKMEIEPCRVILEQDKIVDAHNADVQSWFAEEARKHNDDTMDFCIHTLLTARELERIGDHVCNIAEDVIYLVSGEIIRHMEQDEQEPDGPQSGFAV
jgi:phosphate transport system protein